MPTIINSEFSMACINSGFAICIRTHRIRIYRCIILQTILENIIQIIIDINAADIIRNFSNWNQFVSVSG